MPEGRLADASSVPTDHWTSFESLTVYSLHPYTKNFDLLVRWLTKRLELG